MIVTSLVTPTISIAASTNNICAGTSVTFTATPTNEGTTPIFQWLLNNNPIGTNSPTLTSNTLNNTDAVTCILTSNASCLTIPTASTAPIPITVIPETSPSVTVTPSAPGICVSDPITFKATASNAGTAQTYQWSLNGAKTSGNTNAYTTTTLRDGDQIICTVTGNLACAIPGSSVPLTIPVNPLPSIGFSTDPVYITTAGTQLTPTITGNVTNYEWSPATGLTATDIANPTADPSNPQTYQLLVTTDKGCNTTGKVTVIPRSPLALPGAFTPNGDGHNDLFRIPVGAQITLDQFAVFNRWGAEVFSTRNASTGWDGTIHGSPAPAGTYLYIIKGKDAAGKPIALSGTTILIR